MEIVYRLIAYVFFVIGPVVVAFLGLPLVLYLLYKQPKYRSRISSYILLFFGLLIFFMLLELHIVSFQDRFSVAKIAFFLSALISLIATQAPKKEYAKMLLIFLLPALALALINIFYRLPTQDELAVDIDASLNPDMRNVLGHLWIMAGAWAFACFYRYCIWRIRRVKREQAFRAAA